MTNNTEKSSPVSGSSDRPETPQTEGSQFVSFDVPEDQVGERLDRFISSSLEHYTRSRVKELIKAGHVKRAEKVILEPNCRIKLGDKYDVELPPAAAAIPLAENIPLTIVYEDEHLIVVDKPAGLVVHPATGHWRGTLVNALLYHCGDSLSGVGGVKRPGIVHRLDRQTSGLMVVAKNDTAHLGLSEQFADHGRQGPGRARRVGAPAGIQGRPQPQADPEAADRGLPREAVRRVGRQARHAGAVQPPHEPRGPGADP